MFHSLKYDTTDKFSRAKYFKIYLCKFFLNFFNSNRVSETSLIDGLNKPVPNDQLYVENKENIDYSNTMVSGTSVSQEISVEQKEVMADADASSDDTEGNKQQARLRFQWSATKGLPAHILVVHLRVPFSQVSGIFLYI